MSALRRTDFLKSDLDRWRFLSLIVFSLIVIVLAWQSDDAYHGYVMSRHLAQGDGLVYNIGERATSSTCPLFTLCIAAAYFITHEMFFTSLAVCAIFSTAAYYILAYKLCRTREQVCVSFIILTGSISFVSYTTSGLENSLLFFLGALFLYNYYKNETYSSSGLFALALILSLSAMARMDSVLLYVPAIVWVYLFKRRDVSFIKCVGIGILGLLPFILWECFATFYFGFPFPNPFYVKLGTEIPNIEYVKRGILYTLYTFLADSAVLMVPFASVIVSFFPKKPKYILISSGLCLYGLYVIRIGGDFMMGRHFTNMFFLSLCSYIALVNAETGNLALVRRARGIFTTISIGSVLFALTFGRTVGAQYLSGGRYSSHISDERAYYIGTTGLYNNVVSLVTSGRLCISDTWNNQATDELRFYHMRGGIVENAAGILVYYNPDLYLNDTYALGDPFLSKLPAKVDPNWRVGHLRREVPKGYRESIRDDKNEIEDPDLHEYYDVIRLLTRARLTETGRLRAILDINLGRYNYLIENYERRKKERNIY